MQLKVWGRSGLLALWWALVNVDGTDVSLVTYEGGHSDFVLVAATDEDDQSHFVLLAP